MPIIIITWVAKLPPGLWSFKVNGTDEELEEAIVADSERTGCLEYDVSTPGKGSLFLIYRKDNLFKGDKGQ